MVTRPVLGLAPVVLAALICPPPARAQSVAAVTLVLNASIAPRASVRVSSSNLQFEVSGNGGVSDAVVTFRAAARTQKDGAVRLTVEPRGVLKVGIDAAAAGLSVVCGAEAGALARLEGRPQEVAQWRGSGVREGTVRCRLNGPAVPGRYSLPVSFAVVMD